MNVEAIQSALRDAHVDGWLFFDHHRRDPLAYRILGIKGDAIPTRRWYYFIPAHGDPSALVHRIESHVLDGMPGHSRAYSSWQEQTALLADVLGRARTVAMQYSPQCAIPYVSLVDAGTIELVEQTGVTVVSSADLVQRFESTWSNDQRESHFAAGQRVDRIRAAAFDEIGRRLRANEPVDEWGIFTFIAEAFERDGLVKDHGPIVGVNAHAADPHYEPSPDNSLPIKKGDLILLDMWAKLNRPDAVYYDITWTGFCGDAPPDRITNVFDIVRNARDSAVHSVQTAVRERRSIHGFEVDDAARIYIREHGYGDQFVHRTGHSIGTEVHGAGANMDNLESHDDRLIIPRTCFSVEPGIYLTGDFGIRSEVNVYVGESEAVITGERQTELVRIQC